MHYDSSQIPSPHFGTAWLKKIKGWFTSRWNRHFFLGVAFVLGLAFFINYREVQVESLEVSETAEKYVLAQVGFEFPDIEATSLLKQESLRDVGNVYRIDDTMLLQKGAEIERELIGNSEWRHKLPFTTFEALYAVKDVIQQALLKSRFVNARTWQKMKEINFPQENYFIFDPEEFSHYELSKGTMLPAEFWDGIKTLSFPAGAGTTQNIMYMVQNYKNVPWQYTTDLAAQNAIRQLVKANIPLKLTRVEPGSRIINAGEKVTPRHVDMLKSMKKAISEQQNLMTPLTLMGSLVMAFLFTVISSLYLRLEFPEITQSFSKLALLATITLLTLALAKLTECIFLSREGIWLDFFHFPIFILFGSLLITILLGSRLAFAVSAALAIVLSVTLSFEQHHFLVVNVIAALTSICVARNIRRRKEIFEVAAKVWLVLVPVIFAFNFFQDHFWSIHLVTDLIAAGIFVMATAMMVVALLPIMESAFGIVTDMSLMEYVDPNHPLLRRLSIEAPGSYQHSLVVAALAEEAALAIGANALFCRVATLYHDIGKLSNPQYFTENQFAGFNIHQLLTPFESAQVIISHVSEGVALAEKYGLPQSFCDIILEHHGTTAVYCFFRAQLELMRGDRTRVDELKFRYRGPKPHTKESAVIMIADTLEAAFRSLDEVNEKIAAEQVDRLVSEKMADGQFDECQLTFEEMGAIKKAMIRTLLVIHHIRIKYPMRERVFVPHYEESIVQRF